MPHNFGCTLSSQYLQKVIGTFSMIYLAAPCSPRCNNPYTYLMYLIKCTTFNLAGLRFKVCTPYM